MSGIKSLFQRNKDAPAPELDAQSTALMKSLEAQAKNLSPDLFEAGVTLGEKTAENDPQSIFFFFFFFFFLIVSSSVARHWNVRSRVHGQTQRNS
jgi:hypothetical protein